MSFMRHIHCFIHNLLLGSWIHFTKRWLHKHISCQTHSSFAIERHCNRILSFFLWVSNDSRINSRILRCLRCCQNWSHLFSRRCWKNSLRRKWQSYALMQTWFKFQLVTHFSNKYRAICHLWWTQVRSKCWHIDCFWHFRHPSWIHNWVFYFFTHSERRKMVLNYRTLQSFNLFPTSFMHVRYFKCLRLIFSFILNLHFYILQELTKIVNLRFGCVKGLIKIAICWKLFQVILLKWDIIFNFLRALFINTLPWMFKNLSLTYWTLTLI